MKKRLISLFLIFISILGLTSCGPNNVLLFLNWGEYIDETLITEFEERYNCTVQMDLGDTNEIFYSKAKSGTTIYDVFCPSDYMVEKMYVNGILEELDFSKLPSVNLADEKKSTKKIYQDMNRNLKQKYGDSYVEGTIDKYAVPYMSGTWCIMYRTDKEGLTEAVTNNPKNQWASLFDRTTLPAGTRVGMYDSHQHDYYAACRYLDLDPTIELNKTNLDLIGKTITDMKYNIWGTDNLKKKIVEDNLDLAFMWTGDFIYYYGLEGAKTVTRAYANGDITLDDAASFIDALTGDAKKAVANGKTYEIGYDCFIPDDTIAFCDNLVMNKGSRNKDLAYKFIDFMTSHELLDEEDEVSYPAYKNVYYVGYDAPYQSVYKDLTGLVDPEMFTEDLLEGFDPKAPDDELFDTDLYWAFNDYIVGACFAKYYEDDEYLEENDLEPKGNILAFFDRKYIQTINTTFYNARA